MAVLSEIWITSAVTNSIQKDGTRHIDVSCDKDVHTDVCHCYELDLIIYQIKFSSQR